MWDLHNHILYGIDDGARDADESLQMWHTFAAAGYTGIVATPHRRPGMWNPERAHIAARRDDVLAAVGAVAGAPALALHCGAEHFLDAEFLAVLERDDVSTLGPDTRCFLIEFPVVTPPAGLRDLVFRMRLRRLVPVVAHPERYEWLFAEKDGAQALVAAGCLLQLDLPSLLGMTGRTHRTRAEQLLKAGLAHLCATDVHNAKDAEHVCREAPARLRKLAGEEGARRLLDENPRKVVTGAPPDTIVPVAG
jgi:protein-tyrosine phosphatase